MGTCGPATGCDWAQLGTTGWMLWIVPSGKHMLLTSCFAVVSFHCEVLAVDDSTYTCTASQACLARPAQSCGDLGTWLPTAFATRLQLTNQHFLHTLHLNPMPYFADGISMPPGAGHRSTVSTRLPPAFTAKGATRIPTSLHESSCHAMCKCEICGDISRWWHEQ